MTWNKAPFNNIHFRRAIAWAMPYETLLQVVTQGLAERSRSCVPNNVSGYVGDLWPYETNLAKARGAGPGPGPRGFTVTVPVYADLFDEEATVLIKEHLGAAGPSSTSRKCPSARNGR
jgi:peptide/nickel transport system substrate-binding protein